MSPGDAHGLSALDEFGQRHLARHDGQTQFPSARQLRVPGCHGRGDHDRARGGQVSRVVPERDRHSQRRQVRCAGGVHVATAHGNAATVRDECERTHPGPADSHEVDSALIRGVEQCHV